MEKKNKKISKDSFISEIVEKYPQTEEIFSIYGLHCVGCSASEFDTIQSGCLSHGMDEEEIDEMVELLNEAVEKKLSISSE